VPDPLQGQHRGERIGDGQEHQSALGQVGQFQENLGGGVPGDDGIARKSSCAGPVRVLLQDQDGRALVAQGRAQEAADPAVADHHQMPLEVLSRQVQVGLGYPAEVAAPPTVEWGRQAGREGGQGHGQGRHAEDGQVDVPGQGLALVAQSGQDEGELTHLEHRQAHRRGHDVHVSEDPGDGPEDQALAQEEGPDQEEQRPPLLAQEGRFQQHADADEEEHREQVSQGDDLAQGLVAEFGAGQDHAGQEGSKGEGQAQAVTGVADPQPQSHHCDHEELARAPGGDAGHQPGQQLRAQEEHHGHEERGADQGHAQVREPLVKVSDCRKQDQHRDDRQVLDDQDGGHDPAGQGARQPAVGQELQDHHGA